MNFLKGDCLEVMKSIPDKSVDLIICDLPYGCLSGRAIGKTAEDKKCFSGASDGCAWDIKIDLEVFWKEVRRIRKSDHTPTIHFCTTKFGYELIKSNEKEFRYDLIWNKEKGVSFLQSNKMPMRSHEMMYVFSKAGANYYRKDIEGDFPNTRRGKGKKSNVYNFDYNQFSSTTSTTKRCVKTIVTIPNFGAKDSHPTQKPIDLYKFLIERYSKEGDTILDPTAGSFNSCFVAHEMKRRAIGIEKDTKFFWKAVCKSTSLAPLQT